MDRRAMERRRLAAAVDLGRGMRKADIARRYRVSYVTAWRWETALGTSGIDGLRSRKATGRPPKLRPVQMRRLRSLLSRGARFASGGSGLTSTTVAGLIRGLFRVKYHPNHIPRLLRRLDLAGRAGGPPC